MLTFFIDGACVPNPGNMGCAFYLFERDFSYTKNLGDGTNSLAEWSALFYTLRWILGNKLQDEEVVIYTDSKLVADGANGVIEIYSAKLKKTSSSCRGMIKKVPNLTIKHIPREWNDRANNLAFVAATEDRTFRRGKMI